VQANGSRLYQTRGFSDIRPRKNTDFENETRETPGRSKYNLKLPGNRQVLSEFEVAIVDRLTAGL
jgi:hypothetical protein